MLLYVAAVLFIFIAFYAFKIMHNRKPYAHIEGLTQPLPDMPVRIPLLAPHNYNFCAVTLCKKFNEQFGDAPFIRSTSGHKTALFVRSAEAFKEIILQQAQNFPKPVEVYGVLDLFGSNIVSTNDEAWKVHRRVCEPAFSEKHMRFLALETAKSTELFFERLGKGTVVVETHKEMTDVTLDIIGKVNFGTDLGVYKEVKYDPKVHTMSMRKALEITLGLGLLVRGILPKWMSWMFPETSRAVDEAGLYIRELIENRKADVERFDLLSLIASSNEAALELTNDDMISDSFVFLFAGHETSATTLQWILYELSINHDIQNKAVEEIERVLQGRDPIYDDYDSLVYTNRIISESLRLHPPVNFIPKVARKDTTVTGVKIYKDTMVFLDVYSVHLFEKYWKDPLKFDPDRFDYEKHGKPFPFSYAPFSLGARKCIGSFFSLLETLVILVKILQKYKIEALPDTPIPIPQYQHVTIKPVDLKVKFVPRQTSNRDRKNV